MMTKCPSLSVLEKWAGSQSWQQGGFTIVIKADLHYYFYLDDQNYYVLAMTSLKELLDD